MIRKLLLPRALVPCLGSTMLLLAMSTDAVGSGALGGALKKVAKVTGVRVIGQVGDSLDKANHNLQVAVPPIRHAEDFATEIVRAPFIQACIATYQTITRGVIAQCSNWSGRTNGQDIIQDAVQRLVSAQVFRQDEFNGVEIRWCPLSNAHAITPDRGRIYLDWSRRGDDPDDIAVLIAHEMTHTRQYRRMGTDNFKCTYSQDFVGCGGCQNRHHALEREAYDFEPVAATKLAQYQATLTASMNNGPEPETDPESAEEPASEERAPMSQGAVAQTPTEEPEEAEPEETGWTICNKSSDETVWVAYATSEDAVNWQITGWIEIDRGACEKVSKDIATRYVYFYAEAEDGSKWPGDTNLCVHPTNKFELSDRDDCEAPFEVQAFKEVDTGASRVWTTDLTDD
jgi:uncharacterized membrane protein